MAKRKRYEDYMLLAPGESVPGHNTTYQVERVAGLGAFAAVYFARDPSLPGRQVALKEFFPARHPREQANLAALFERERTVGMLASPHPLMPTFYEAFQHDGHHYIAQEFIEGSTLDDIIFKRHPLPREWILKWAVSLCDALAFLHSRQVVHHDLKPANIRITPQGIWLCWTSARHSISGMIKRRRSRSNSTARRGTFRLNSRLTGDGWPMSGRTSLPSVASCTR